MFDPVASSVSLPKQEEKTIRFWNERQIYEKTLAAGRRAAVCVLRGPAHGQRPAAPRPLPHPGDQGPFPALQDHARLLLPAQGRLGYPWAAGRSRGLQGTGHPRQGGNRVLRRRTVHPQVHRERLSLHARVGRIDRTARLLDPSRRGLRHLSPKLRGERPVGVENILRARLALPGTQDRLVVGPRRYGAVQRRGRAGLP